MGAFGGSARTIVATGLGAVSLTILVIIATQYVGNDSPGVMTGTAELSLSDAVAAGDLNLANAILEGGSDPDKPLVQGFTPLMRAAIRNDAVMIGLLLDAGANHEAIAMEGLTPLHVAAEAGAVDAAKTLLEAGADLNIRSHNGMNTLEHAAAADSVEVIEAIAARGIDLDAQSGIITQGHGYPIDKGSTALGIAARAGHIDAIRALLDLGADVDAPSAVGHTPLLLAVFSGQPPEVISVLLRAGADPTVRAACRTRCSYEEGDVLEWARRIGDPNTIPLLQEALDR
jgi:ankyrin repeat protein